MEIPQHLSSRFLEAARGLDQQKVVALLAVFEDLFAEVYLHTQQQIIDKMAENWSTATLAMIKQAYPRTPERADNGRTKARAPRLYNPKRDRPRK